MHIAHIIAVEATNAEEAASAAGEAISDYGDGRVWDWYVVGGRWEGSLEGGNTLQYSANPKAFRKAVENMLQYRDEEFMKLQSKLTGKDVTAEELTNDTVFGIPITDPEGAAKRVSEDNRRARREVGRLFEASSLKEAQHPTDTEYPGRMVAYYLRKFANCILGEYSFDSRFFDGEEHTTESEGLWVRCDDSPEEQWLVLLDLHN